MAMTKKYYEIVAGAIARTRMVAELDKNAVRRQSKLQAIGLLTTDVTASLEHEDPKFDRKKFLKLCGVSDAN